MNPDRLPSIAFHTSSAIISFICSVLVGTGSSSFLSVISKLKRLLQLLNISFIA
ncbi:hypothetical protein HanRHA438_Chr07g0319181 [Helianthus annuus]|nr:hypothetical protein HanRHA438_Chr07g0319181 [Helianthus annuus]